MRTLLAAALAVLPLLAGCSSGDGGPAEPIEATATTGILKGVVVDEAIRPLLGVRITVPMADGTTLNSTTAADGAFAFGDLPPGGYVVQARKLGYLDAALAANVTAGEAEPAGLRLQMLADVLNAPFVEQFQFSGFLQCSFTAFVARVAACNPSEAAQPLCNTPAPVCTGPIDNVTADEFMAVHSVSRQTVRFLQSELVWEAGSQLSSSLKALPGSRDPATGEINDYRPFEGVSPLAMPMDGAVAQALFIGNGKDLVIRVFAGYVNETAPPTCLPSPVGCPWGIGASYEQ
ncbi:MAG TPA: carboxypeptidase-like regulatory domain-containing protein, partial [Candidatus Thermoplasmatota archaeon]|nr:carboxypeptidase-like regulatory domain-containing protein [Candidatus Thermoplasmatota archaeon]